MAEHFLNVTHRPDGVAVLTFDAPNSRANVLTRAVWQELRDALQALAVRPGTTGLVLASAKPDVFIAGADLKFLAAVPAPNDPEVRELIGFGNATLALLESHPFPTAAAINGAALGGGLEVALACDVRVGGPNPKAELGLPEVTLGLIPGWGGTQRLPRVSELEAATGMLLTGQPLSVIDAEAKGLIDVLVHSGSVIDAAAEAVRGRNPEPYRRRKREPLLPPPPSKGGPGEVNVGNPTPPGPTLERGGEEGAVPVNRGGEEENPAAIELTRLLDRGPRVPLAEAIALETEAFLRLAGSDDARRRINAFFAVRKR